MSIATRNGTITMRSRENARNATTTAAITRSSRHDHAAPRSSQLGTANGCGIGASDRDSSDSVSGDPSGDVRPSEAS